MPYIGNPPANKFVTPPEVQRFNGDNSTTDFTLANTIGADQDILVSVDGVIQDTTSYSVNDKTLTFTTAPSSGTNNIFVFTISPLVASVNHPATSPLNATSGTFTGNLTTSGTTSLDGAVTINESGASVDFRVESDTDVNALVVDGSANRVGIGVATPASKLEISAGVNSHGLLRLDDTDAGNLGGYMQFDSNGTNKANIQNANNAGIHLCVGTGGSVVFTALGYTAANALDDYEEGTFTATLEGSTTNPTTPVTLSSARYTKIGRQVMVQGQFSNVDTTGAAGGVRVTGLPFTASTAFASGNVMTYLRFTLGTTSTNISPYISGTQLSFYQSTTGSPWGEIAHSAGTGAYLSWTVIYDTNS